LKLNTAATTKPITGWSIAESSARRTLRVDSRARAPDS
jgi:hypothetical protein